MRILITGATGFIGRRFVRACQESGIGDISCLVRDRARARGLGLPEDALVDGDLADPDALRRGAAGAALIIHLAASVRALRTADLFAANAGGTRLLLAAAEPSARFVLVSSLAAAGPSRDGRDTDRPAARCSPCSAYGESKRQAELALVADATRTGRSWLVLRPGVVYGPGDAATRVLTAQARAWVTAVPPSPRPLSVIHVDDVCSALLAAVRKPEVQALFLPLVGGVPTDTHSLLTAIAAAHGRRARLLPVPLPIARCAAHLAQAWARVTGRPTFFNPDKVREIGAEGWVGDPEPAARALGFRAQIDLRAGLAALAAVPLR